MLSLYLDMQRNKIYRRFNVINKINQEELYKLNQKALRSIDVDFGRNFSGFCGVMVDYWFKRITNDKTSWSTSYHNKAIQQVPYNAVSERWQKKTLSLYAHHKNLGAPYDKPHKFLPATPEVLYYENSNAENKEDYQKYLASKRELFQHTPIYPLTYAVALEMTQRIMAEQISSDITDGLHNKGKYILIRARLMGRIGMHAVGFYRQINKHNDIDKTQWDIVDEDLIYCFDPELGEFQLHSEEMPLFLMALINDYYYTPILGPMFNMIQLERQPIYW